MLKATAFSNSVGQLSTLTLKIPTMKTKYTEFSKRNHAAYWANPKVRVDNNLGIGVTARHRSVAASGFLNRMRVGDFFKLCGCTPHQDLGTRVVERVGLGESVASPLLYIDIEGFLAHSKQPCRVAGYEGLEVCAALEHFGVEDFNFQFVLLGYGMRNIDDLNAFFNWLSSGIISLNNTRIRMPINKTLV